MAVTGQICKQENRFEYFAGLKICIVEVQAWIGAVVQVFDAMIGCQKKRQFWV